MLSFTGSTPTLYGLDVLALTDSDPVDPLRARIRTIGIATDGGAVSFSGDETGVLTGRGKTINEVFFRRGRLAYRAIRIEPFKHSKETVAGSSSCTVI